MAAKFPIPAASPSLALFVAHSVHPLHHLPVHGVVFVAAKYLKPAEEEKARERMEATQIKGGTAPENLPEPIGKGDARDLAAAQVGLSGKTVDAAARAIKKAARHNAEPPQAGQPGFPARQIYAASP